MFGKPKAEGAGSPSQKIEVVDVKNNVTTSYYSISAAALALNIKNYLISMFLAEIKVNLTKADIFSKSYKNL